MKYRVIEKQTNSHNCFVCGMDNPAGIKARFYNVENESGEKVLLTIVDPKEQPIHQSYPDRMHGGVISALLDESIGRSVQFLHPDIWAVTIDLAIKFRKPVPINETIYIESHITNLGSRAFEGEGRMFDRHNATLATAVGKFFRVSVDVAFPELQKSGEKLFVVPEPMPEYIVI